MIGQTKLKNSFNSIDQSFIIFVGKKGCGKKTFAKYLANKFGLSFVLCGGKTDNIKELTTLTQSVKTIYYIDNFDTLSINATSALLNVTEEPNDNKIIISGAEIADRLPKPIVSRAELHYFEPYTQTELQEYKTDISNDILPFLQNPGQVNLLNETIYEYFTNNVKSAVHSLRFGLNSNIDNLYGYVKKYDAELFIDAVNSQLISEGVYRFNDNYCNFKAELNRGANSDRAAFIFMLNATN